MGLDMYLEKMPKIKGYNFGELIEISNHIANYINGKEELEKYEKYEELKPYIKNRGEYFNWYDLREQIGYWRKANQIHRWFVENIQNDVDDCGYYEVSKEQLIELKELCEKILNADNNDFELVAKGTLPTLGGFFFGSTGYDEWYKSDIKNTVEIINKALEETDFENNYIIYTSSW